MTTPQPNFIDLHSQSQASLARPLKSPRLPAAGDVPPELSPLDAFALQSRLLAKQLEESVNSANRLSRLPPLTTASPLIVQGRSTYFRSLSQDSYSDTENNPAPDGQRTQLPLPTSSQGITPTSGLTPEVEEPTVRPQSLHPRMSHIPSTPNYDAAPPPVPAQSRERQRRMRAMAEGDEEDFSIFGVRTDRSPSPWDDDFETRRQRDETASALEAEPSKAALENSPEASPEALLEAVPETEREAAALQRPPSVSEPGPSQTRQLRSTNSQAIPQQHQPTHQPPPVALPINTLGSISRPLTQSPEPMPTKKTSFDSASVGGLAPPRQLFTKRSSSIMSSPLDSGDGDSSSGNISTFHSLGAPRKLSNSSGMPSPGFSSFHGSFQRSPSFDSDISAPLPRPSFNFSRPLSRVSTPGLESPARQASSDSHTSYSQSSLAFADDPAHTPVSTQSEYFPDSASQTGEGVCGAAPSYIYSKFSLPRGKMLQQSGPPLLDDNIPSASYQWEQTYVLPSNVQPFGGQAPPSPPTRPASSSGLAPRPSFDRTKLSTTILAAPSSPPKSSQSVGRPSTDTTGAPFEEPPRGRTMASTAPSASARARTPASVTTTNTDGTSDSTSTVKPRTMQSLVSAVEVPAEVHVDRAVALHEQGKLSESTYHLRHAARQGHPTGMLLYALACRHGWGMRANQREGAIWLRKAADCASVEIADEEAQIKEGKRVDAVDLKTHKAQFALSIYELGVSYMNGWGIDQDRALGLRCFEIAGSWGDADALAEAGFCYAQGIGCKKNLKRSAHFYRQAEAKGMSMVGNSWIHKSKYNDDKDSIRSGKSGKSVKEQKARAKSRTRNIFGIKHSS